MATANQMRAAAREAMRQGAVIITAADFLEGRLARVQAYFWDENEAVMDIVDAPDLLQNWPDEGVFVLNPAGQDEREALLPVGVYYDEANDQEYVRVPAEDAPNDDLGSLPSVVFMDAVEQICMLKEKK